jgi:UDP-N-acetylglucosamine/UDP-N-acetylgalactosamine diphosphorylase
MAGGQGTRLGCVGPKGLVDPGLPLSRNLFQIQANRFISFCQKYEISLPKWLIMTSDATHDETISNFMENNYYGYDSNRISFFKQGNLPSVSEDNKKLTLHGKIVENPDGSGGIIPALHQSNLINELEYEKIQTIVVYNVDNLLVELPDPVYVGFLIETNVDASAKGLTKARPDEAVGVFASNSDGKPCVLEYTDTPKETLAQFKIGNAGIYAFSTDFVIKMKDQQIPKHRSWKKVPCDQNLSPSQPNAWKEETFIFDWYPFTNSFIWWEISRKDEFAPLKNADPNPIDSPQAARDLWYQKWSSKARKHGANLPENAKIDISTEAEFWTEKEWNEWAILFNQRTIIIQ